MDSELQPWVEFWRMIASLGFVTLVFWMFSIWGRRPAPKPVRRMIEIDGVWLTVDEAADGTCEVVAFEVPGSGLDPAIRGDGKRLAAFWTETVRSWQAAQRVAKKQ